jgi:glutamate--cysteine ligase
MPHETSKKPSTMLTEATAQEHVHGICFKTGPPRQVGVELEWFIRDLRDPSVPVAPERHAAAVRALRSLPLSRPLTFEPGGQLELSPPPTASLTECVAGANADLTLVRAALDNHGLGLMGRGHDPRHPPRRLLSAPRYVAMETYFDRHGPAGRSMMCSSASVQVCLDAGNEEPGPLGFGRRWRLAHLLGAVLVAAFANSPLSAGRPTGWKSTRQAVWAGVDPARSLAPAEGGDPRIDWAEYVLDTPVMCVRRPEGPWTVPQGLTFRDWIRGGLPRPPDLDDLDYHLTTLFPPVRPRGYLELRMIDAQPGEDGWLVPLAVTAALFDDPQASETVYRAVKPLAETAGSRPAPRNPLWRSAARHALADPELHAAAGTCFAAAQDALDRLGASARIQAAVAEYAQRYVARGRCPADDLLDSPTGKESL